MISRGSAVYTAPTRLRQLKSGVRSHNRLALAPFVRPVTALAPLADRARAIPARDLQSRGGSQRRRCSGDRAGAHDRRLQLVHVVGDERKAPVFDFFTAPEANTPPPCSRIVGTFELCDRATLVRTKTAESACTRFVSLNASARTVAVPRGWTRTTPTRVSSESSCLIPSSES